MAAEGARARTRPPFFRYAAPPNKQTVSIVLIMLGTIYVVIPICLLPILTGSVPVETKYVAVAVLTAVAALLMNIREIVLFRAERWDDFYPLYNFVELVFGVIGTVALGLAAGDGIGLYRPLMLLVLLLTAVIFDGPGLFISWVLCLAGLTVVASVQTDSALSTFWVVLVYGGVFGIAASMIHYLVHRAFAELDASGALSAFASESSDVTVWDDDLAACLPHLGDALMVDHVAVMRRRRSPSNGTDPDDADRAPAAHEVVQWPEGWLDATTLADLANTTDTVLTPKGDELLAISCATSQVDVVLIVPSGNRLLGSQLNDINAITAVNLVAGVADRLALITRLRDRAVTDELTGLGNRRKLFEVLHYEIERTKRSGTPLSIAMIDLDHFKDFNDQFGHQAGDDLLHNFADTVSSRVRSQDTLARYGGEEFCLVLPTTDAVGAEELLKSIRRTRIDGPGKTVVTYSVGVADWAEGETVDALVKRADEALYAAKETGRDRVVLATRPPDLPDPDWATNIATAANAITE